MFLFVAAAIAFATVVHRAPAAHASPAPPAIDSDTEPVYKPDSLPDALREDFMRRGLKLDGPSGNYLAPKVFGKTLHESLVSVKLGGRYLKDLKGHVVFLRKSIRDKLLIADEAMFKKKKQHVQVTYGFRSNAVQADLYKKLAGHAVVAPPGGSFHETGMALDIANWHEAQSFMIDAGFVGGCRGIEEDMVHYSIGELTRASNAQAFKRCTFREIPEDVVKGVKKIGDAVKGNPFRKKN
jgi:hypothetical protein